MIQIRKEKRELQDFDPIQFNEIFFFDCSKVYVSTIHVEHKLNHEEVTRHLWILVRSVFFPKMSLKFSDFIIWNDVFLYYRMKKRVTDFFGFCNPETSKIWRVT